MTSVLVIDPDEQQRTNLEKELQDSNQFGRVCSCEGFEDSEPLIDELSVEVVLIDRELIQKKSAFKAFQAKHPNIGLVLVSESGQLPDSAELEQVGVHAQTSRLSSPIDKMACIAKALVARFKPSKRSRRLFKKFMKD